MLSAVLGVRLLVHAEAAAHGVVTTWTPDSVPTKLSLAKATGLAGSCASPASLSLLGRHGSASAGERWRTAGRKCGRKVDVLGVKESDLEVQSTNRLTVAGHRWMTQPSIHAAKVARLLLLGCAWKSITPYAGSG